MFLKIYKIAVLFEVLGGLKGFWGLRGVLGIFLVVSGALGGSWGGVGGMSTPPIQSPLSGVPM